jgi:hypothetical protein
MAQGAAMLRLLAPFVVFTVIHVLAWVTVLAIYS